MAFMQSGKITTCTRRLPRCSSRACSCGGDLTRSVARPSQAVQRCVPVCACGKGRATSHSSQRGATTWAVLQSTSAISSAPSAIRQNNVPLIDRSQRHMRPKGAGLSRLCPASQPSVEGDAACPFSTMVRSQGIPPRRLPRCRSSLSSGLASTIISKPNHRP